MDNAIKLLLSMYNNHFKEGFADLIAYKGDITVVGNCKLKEDIEKFNGADGLFEIATPVVFHNKHIGNIIIGINRSILMHTRSETRNRILLGLAIVMLLRIGCILVQSSYVTKPIKELLQGVNDLKRGRVSKLRIYSHNELGNLTDSFNPMAELITRQRSELSTNAQELEEAYVSTVKVLSAAIDARDPYTLGHSTRVARLSVKIGEMLGFSHRELEDLEVACLFHVVGKIKTPDYILLKEGSLNPLEHYELEEHAEQRSAMELMVLVLLDLL